MTVARIAGHSDISTTAIYTQPNGKDMEKAIEGLVEQIITRSHFCVDCICLLWYGLGSGWSGIRLLFPPRGTTYRTIRTYFYLPHIPTQASDLTPTQTE